MTSRGVSLQKSLLFNLAAGIVLLGAGLLTISLVATDQAVARLSGALTNRVIATTDAQIMGFFEPVQSAIEVTADRVSRGDFEMFPLDVMDRYYEPIIDQMQQLSSVMYAHDDGDEYMLLQSNGMWGSRQTRPESWGGWEVWRSWQAADDDKSGERREIDYDARRRPWFEGALERLDRVGAVAPIRDRIHWTTPYKFFTTQEPGVTASVAVRTASGRIAVLGFDILLADISRFTSQLEISNRGKVFVLRGEPSSPQEMVVVGLPSDDRFTDDETLLEFVLSPPHGLGGPVASFVAEALTAESSATTRAVQFVHEGETWWGEIAQSKLRTSDDIWVGSVLPEEDLLAGLPNTSFIVIFATAVVLLLAILRSTRLARRYGRPLEQLTDRGNRMQRLNFEPVELVESDITEIRHLSATLERMRAALQTFSAEREDLRVARSIREMTLPKRLPTVPGLDLAVWHQDSDQVGGETYDAALEPGSDDAGSSRTVVLATFDFTGAGIGAAVYGSQLRAVFRSGVRDRLQLTALATKLDEFVRSDLAEPESLRLCLLRINAPARRLTVLAFGQDVLLHRCGEGRVERISSGGSFIGLHPKSDLPEPLDVVLSPGDRIVVASDGVLDALDDKRQRYGSAGLEQSLLQLDRSESAGALTERIVLDVARYASGPSSDRTVLAVVLKNEMPPERSS